MKSIVYPLLFICLLAASCSSNLHIEVIEIKDYGQFFDTKRKSLFTLGHTTKVVFNGTNRLFIEARMSLTTKGIFDNTGKKVDEVITKQDTSYMVYVFEKGRKNGISYHLDSFKEKHGTVFNVDSIIKELSLDDQNNQILNMDLGRPNEVLREKQVVLEKFLLSKKKPSDPDSIYRYYDRGLRNIDFSFSKKLDRQKNSKLVKTLFIYNQTNVLERSKEYTIPRRVMETSMVRVNKDIDYLKEIFEKFQKDKKKQLNL